MNGQKNNTTLCPMCSKDLADCKTIFAAEGTLYCSRTCGIYDFKPSQGEEAEAYFDSVAEEIVPADIGIVKAEMDKEHILGVIKSLAASQGYYSRLYTALMKSTDEERNEWLAELAEMRFVDDVELIEYLEG